MKLSVLAKQIENSRLKGEDREVSTVCEPGGPCEVELWLEGPVQTDKPAIVDSEVELQASNSVLIVPELKSRLPLVLQEFERGPTGRGISPGAQVEDDFECGDPIYIGHGTRIGRNVKIGSNVHIDSNVTITGDVRIGDKVQLHSGVRIESPADIGNNTIIHANTVIGADGYGFYEEDNIHHKIPQVGRVEIGENVEIGANSTVDRATYGVTRIGAGSKLDDQVHVAHNCRVGKNCIIAGKSGLSGSAVLGDNVTVGGLVAITDHVSIADNVTVAGRAGVTKDINEEGIVISGFPAQSHRKELKRQANIRRIPKLKANLKKLQNKVEQLERESE
ncbi:MAG: UDP-3-O-(3-hydroxymyristoyl)glucosamine N-acyltransferase [bacterium]